MTPEAVQAPAPDGKSVREEVESDLASTLRLFLAAYGALKSAK